MKLWNTIEYLKEEDFMQDKASPWVGHNNKNLMRQLDEDFDGVPSREYVTKDDLRMKRNLNKLDVERKLRKQQAEEAKEN